MKTNQIMTRQMGQFKVEQRTKDGMFNATALLKQWNEHIKHANLHTHLDGYVKANILRTKDLDDYFKNTPTHVFMRTIAKREGLDGEKSTYTKSKARLDRGGGTWMHPLLFVDFCMWLNPVFKYDVLKFVYDQMIRYRNDAGDAYKELGSAVGKIVNKSFIRAAMSNIGKALNWCVFNAHEPMIRNKEGEEEKMRELWQLEHKVSDLINEGFIKSYDELIEYLRRTWINRYTPKAMITNK